MFKYKLNGRDVSLAESLLSCGLILAVLVTLILQYYYYSQLFGQVEHLSKPIVVTIAFCFGLIIQLSRLGFVFAGVEEFATGRKRSGYIGFVFSIALSIYETVEMYFLVKHWWTGDYFTPAMMAVQFLVWIAFVLELRWALNVGGKSSEGFSYKRSEKSRSESQNEERFSYN